MSLKQVKLKWKFIPDNLQKFMPVEGTSTVNVERVVIESPSDEEYIIIHTGSQVTPEITGYDPEKMTMSGDTAATDAGTYTVVITPKYGYKWSDGTTEPKSITWDIINAIPFTVTADNRAKVGYTGTEGEELVIPATFIDPDDGVAYKVVAIGENAFYNCDFKSIIIPEGVETIGVQAFNSAGSAEMEIIEIPNTVTSIGDKAFSGCNITSITIPGSVKTIGKKVFEYCDKLTSVTIEEGVETIGKGMFFMCERLSEVNIPNSVKYIESEAFAECQPLKSIIIPEGVESIGFNAFSSTELNTVYYTGTEEQWNAINIESPNDELINATKKYLQPLDVTYRNRDKVGYTGAEGENLVIPATFIDPDDGEFYKVTELGFRTFYQCTNLNSVVIPEGVTIIGSRAFYGCTNLTEVTIPLSVVEIGPESFVGCDSLTTVYYAGTQEEWDAIYISNDNTSLFNANIVVKELKPFIVTSNNKAKVGYTGTEGENLVIPETFVDPDDGLGYKVVGIEMGAFFGCSKLSSVTIPNTVTTIGDGAFQSCTGLTSIDIPEGVESIGVSTFQGCTALTEIEIPGSVTNIGKKTFQGCTALTEIEIPEGVEIIGDSAFRNCNSLESVVIPEGVTTIEGCAFQNCIKLTSIKLPNTITSIGNSVFYGCVELTSIKLPNKLTSIGTYTFDGCIRLESIEIYESVTSIKESAFIRCDALNTVYYTGTEEQWNAINIESGNEALTNAVRKYAQEYILTDSRVVGYTGEENEHLVIPATLVNPFTGDYCKITKIEDSLFQDCSNLASVTIEEGVETIGPRAFMNCYNLNKVVIPGSIKTIEFATFSCCRSLKEVIIPEGIETIGNSAFNDCGSLTSVTIPNTVTTIGEGAFNSCYSLTTVNYTGTEEEWNTINIGLANDSLIYVTINYI